MIAGVVIAVLVLCVGVGLYYYIRLRKVIQPVQSATAIITQARTGLLPPTPQAPRNLFFDAIINNAVNRIVQSGVPVDENTIRNIILSMIPRNLYGKIDVNGITSRVRQAIVRNGYPAKV